MAQRKPQNEKSVSSAKHKGKHAGTPRLGSEAETYSRLFRAVGDFIDSEYNDAVEDALEYEWRVVFPEGFDNPDEMPLMMTFYDWLVHTDSVLETGYTGVDLYLEQAGQLPAGDHIMLERMRDSAVSLFELRVSGNRKSVQYVDLLLGDRFEIEGVEIPPGYTRGLIGGRRILLDGCLNIGVGSYPFPAEAKDELLEMIREEYEEYLVDNPGDDMEEFLKQVDPIPDIWLDGLEDEEGEEIPPVTYSALYEIMDQKKVLAKLRSIPSLHETEKNMFEWIGESEDGEPEPRGAVSILDDNLALGAFTPELREAGKIMLKSVCSGLIRHTKDFEIDEDMLDSLDEET